jgi:hypothetical protein
MKLTSEHLLLWPSESSNHAKMLGAKTQCFLMNGQMRYNDS